MIAPSAASEQEAILYIIALIYERSRIRLHSGKESLIRARLGKRMRFFGMSSLSEYCNYLRSGTDPDELIHVVDSLATNFTHFLREEDHFRFMVQQALPALGGARPRRFNLWSAACATGEEPFSAAFYLDEHFPLAAGWNWSILATDISTKALQKAQQAIYPEDRLQMLPAPWLRKYFQRGQGESDGFYRVKPYLRERVSFRQMNLLGDYSFSETFDIIFCRNVMIYFDRPNQETLVRHLCRFLSPQGHLFIGHSESLNGLSIPLRCVRPSYYQRC